METFRQVGKLINRGELKQLTPSFRKREFCIEITETVGNSEIVNYAKFQLLQDRCEMLSAFKLGEMVNVFFTLRGYTKEKDGNTIYVNALDCYKIVPVIEGVNDRYKRNYKGYGKDKEKAGHPGTPN